MARYYKIDFDEKSGTFNWSVDSEKKSNAEKVDGAYLLRTDRKDLSEKRFGKHTYC